MKIHADAYISRGRFESGTTTTYNIKKEGNSACTFLIEGNITIDSQPLESRDAPGITQTNSFDIEVSDKADILVIEVGVG